MLCAEGPPGVGLLVGILLLLGFRTRSFLIRCLHSSDLLSIYGPEFEGISGMVPWGQASAVRHGELPRIRARELEALRETWKLRWFSIFG